MTKKPEQLRRMWSPRNPWPLFSDWRQDVRIHYGIERQKDAFTDEELMELEAVWTDDRPPSELDRRLRRKLYRVKSGGEWVE
jgi:hypothetical protein